MPHITAIVNAKGGVGKTTTCIALGQGIAMKGYRTLIVDCDFQANAALAMGYSRLQLTPTLMDVFRGMPIVEAVQQTPTENLSIIFASPDLIFFDALLLGHPSKEVVLKQALEPLFEQFDYILIDSPASLSLLPINALVASQNLLVPVQLRYLSEEGVITLLDRLSSLREMLSYPIGQVLGIVLTLVERPNSPSTQASITDVREALGDLVFETVIPYSRRQVNATARGQSIFRYRSAPVSVAYVNLVNEYLDRVENLHR
jgi:chromosome partitioning protein